MISHDNNSCLKLGKKYTTPHLIFKQLKISIQKLTRYIKRCRANACIQPAFLYFQFTLCCAV